jgi:hypothetical protein
VSLEPCRNLQSAAARYLEERQRELLVDTGIQPDWHERQDSEEVAAFLATAAGAMGWNESQVRQVFEARFAQAMEERPSRYEDPWLFSLLSEMATEIESVAEGLGMTLPQRPVFGTLPLGQLNAMAVRVPNTEEYLIAFQYGMFGFMNLASKAFAAALPSVEDGDGISFNLDRERVLNHLAANAEPVARMSDFLGAYIYAGDPHAAEQYFVTASIERLSGLLRGTAERFIIGHEYGHLISGHLAPSTPRREKEKPVTFEAPPRAWRHEIEADFSGMVLAVHSQAQNGLDLALSYAGVDFAFTAMELAERALAVARHGDAAERKVADTHPPTTTRRHAARLALGALSPSEQAQESARGLGEALETVGDLMWEQIEPEFRDRYRGGDRPSQIWGG